MHFQAQYLILGSDFSFKQEIFCHSLCLYPYNNPLNKLHVEQHWRQSVQCCLICAKKMKMKNSKESIRWPEHDSEGSRCHINLNLQAEMRVCVRLHARTLAVATYFKQMMILFAHIRLCCFNFNATNYSFCEGSCNVHCANKFTSIYGKEFTNFGQNV